ncbi:M48 family metallopeptidase [Streptomyces uncialis]|uniref:M48 family metallopeptidase n=1 Tax=Streptomyces uncialis TaxID=1048205 RepID=UPI0036602F8F
MPSDPVALDVTTDDRALVDNEILLVDGRRLRVRINARRRRLGLTVERDRTLTLRVPEECGTRRARDFVRASHSWIEEKLRLSDARSQLHPVRDLRSGEIHRYLGRDHRILVVDDEPIETVPTAASPPVRLVAGRLRMGASVAADPVRARDALADWYIRAGQRWMRGRLHPWAARMDVREPAVHVRDLGHRWGSYRAGGANDGLISLHWAVFQLPIHLIDYVVAHELAHVRVSGHGPEYWRLLGRALPECRRLKAELDDLGRRVWMGDIRR